MDRDTTLLFALVMLAVAGLSVGIGGWILFVRDHRLAKAAHGSSEGSPGATVHPGVAGEL
jgi:hypothetical protein